MNKLGIVFGGYCPMTRGHMEVIMQAKKECEKLFIIVCGSNNESRANEIGLDLVDRFEMIYKLFKYDINGHFINEDNLQITYINDDEIGLKEQDMLSIHNWTIWLEEVDNLVSEYFLVDQFTHKDITFYVGEKSYYNVLTKNFDYNCKLIDRKLIPISGTKIRQNPVKYWDYIIKPFRPAMCKKILVIGTASEGKSTLVEDIARYYNLSMVDERGRELMYQMGLTDVDLNYHAFNKFVINQNIWLRTTIADTSEPFIISDTDNLVTLMYATAYAYRDDMPNMSEKTLEYVRETVEKSINDIKWDKIFVLTPNNTFVDDGTRFMGQSSIEERTKNFNILKELIDKYYSYADVEYITGGEYLKNFNIVKKYIQSFYN